MSTENTRRLVTNSTDRRIPGKKADKDIGWQEIPAEAENALADLIVSIIKTKKGVGK